MITKKIIITNFWGENYPGDRNLYEEDLRWSDVCKEDAKSDCPEYIFRYYIEEVGLNMLFYWIKDRNFYTIETEKDPIEVRRIYPNPNWDGKCEYEKAGIDSEPNTASKGEIIATFDSPEQVWNGLFINGTPIGDILDQSYIIDLD